MARAMVSRCRSREPLLAPAHYRSRPAASAGSEFALRDLDAFGRGIGSHQRISGGGAMHKLKLICSTKPTFACTARPPVIHICPPTRIAPRSTSWNQASRASVDLPGGRARRAR